MRRFRLRSQFKRLSRSNPGSRQDPNGATEHSRHAHVLSIVIRITTIQSYSGDGPAGANVAREGFFGRVLRGVTVLVTLALGAAAALGVLLVGFAVAAFALAAWCVMSLYVAARRFVIGTRAPNGALDGRRNVRVVARSADDVVDQTP